MGKPDGFLAYAREDAPRRDIEERVRDYREVDLPMLEPAIRTQASRCMDCGIPFCHGAGCPLANRIPEMNDRVYRGRWREAAAILHTTSNFPEVTGRVCPGPCEAACTLGLHGEAVTVRSLERAVADRAWAEGWVVPQPPAASTGRRVAIIGSGPAGLAAAQELARKGHDVTVFEKERGIGGILRYGIPDFKLPKGLLDRRLAQMEAEGVRFEAGVTVGEDILAPYLRKRFDAIVLAIGAGVPRDLDVPGRELGGLHFAMDFLGSQIRLNAGEDVAAPIHASGKRVLVIGGGDTGSDCVGTAVRQGARDVRQIELLSRPPEQRPIDMPWPLWPKLLRTTTSHEEGCTRRWNIRTDALEGEDGSVTRWRGCDTQTGETLDLDIDLVILALGFLPLASRGLAESFGLERDDRGNIRTRADGSTNVPGVFAAGDAALGASLVVKAIRTGRQAAGGVDAYLKG